MRSTTKWVTTDKGVGEMGEMPHRRDDKAAAATGLGIKAMDHQWTDSVSLVTQWAAHKTSAETISRSSYSLHHQSCPTPCHHHGHHMQINYTDRAMDERMMTMTNVKQVTTTTNVECMSVLMVQQTAWICPWMRPLPQWQWVHLWTQPHPTHQTAHHSGKSKMVNRRLMMLRQGQRERSTRARRKVRYTNLMSLSNTHSIQCHQTSPRLQWKCCTWNCGCSGQWEGCRGSATGSTGRRGEHEDVLKGVDRRGEPECKCARTIDSGWRRKRSAQWNGRWRCIRNTPRPTSTTS